MTVSTNATTKETRSARVTGSRLTLGDLEELVLAAKATGISGDTPVQAPGSGLFGPTRYLTFLMAEVELENGKPVSKDQPADDVALVH